MTDAIIGDYSQHADYQADCQQEACRMTRTASLCTLPALQLDLSE
jgi:hypothetical protein